MNAHESQEPMESLAAELIRRGLPPDYAQRAAAELAEHRRDLVEELVSQGGAANAAEAAADRRLGEPRELVRKLAREYRRRTLAGRWPIATFVVSPLLTAYASWVLAALAVSSGCACVSRLGAFVGVDGVSNAAVATAKLVAGWTLFNVVAPVTLAVGFARLARRAGLSWRWTLASVVQVALVAGLLHWSADYRQGRAGFLVPCYVGDTRSFLQFLGSAWSPWLLVQIAIPLAALAVVLRLDRRSLDRRLSPSST